MTSQDDADPRSGDGRNSVGLGEAPGWHSRALSDTYDLLLLDLDGTVYRGAEPIDGVAEALGRAGSQRLFVTNNASRAPAEVARRLNGMGIDAVPDEIVTSAQAGARLVASGVQAGAQVLVVGAEALADEVQAQGLEPVRTCTGEVAAVIQGFARSVAWSDLAEAALAIRAGAWWVATNVDSTLPDERGLLPGNGSLVAALATATSASPTVAGKPARPIMDDAVHRGAGDRPLVVGDRLDTDIAGACAAGLDSMLVLTGVSTPAELIRADPSMRPTHVARDLRALAGTAAESVIAAQQGWNVDVDGEVMRVSVDAAIVAAAEEAAHRSQRSGVVDLLAMPGLRAAAAAAWQHCFTGEVEGCGPVTRTLARQWNLP